jgi:hypothetical protein
MASAIFLVHKHDVHCPHLSVLTDIQEPDEAKLVTEEPKEAGKSDPNRSELMQNTHNLSCGVDELSGGF